MKSVVRIFWLLSLSAQTAFVEWGAVQVWGMHAVIIFIAILSLPLAFIIWMLVIGF